MPAANFPPSASSCAPAAPYHANTTRGRNRPARLTHRRQGIRNPRFTTPPTADAGTRARGQHVPPWPDATLAGAPGGGGCGSGNPSRDAGHFAEAARRRRPSPGCVCSYQMDRVPGAGGEGGGRVVRAASGITRPPPEGGRGGEHDGHGRGEGSERLPRRWRPAVGWLRLWWMVQGWAWAWAGLAPTELDRSRGERQGRRDGQSSLRRDGCVLRPPRPRLRNACHPGRALVEGRRKKKGGGRAPIVMRGQAVVFRKRAPHTHRIHTLEDRIVPGPWLTWLSKI